MKTTTFTLFCLAYVFARGQDPLATYVELGLKNNLILQQKNIQLEQALYALKTANSLFLPGINFKMDYQSGEGGRSIGIPIGDLLNPVYGTLNQLTMSQSFPQVSNVETTFFPNNFYDARIRTSMPLFNTDLLMNRNIQKQQIILQEYDVTIYKMELTKMIKEAYFTYLMALEHINIYENALALAQEGKRINESLAQNGKLVNTYLLRSINEIEQLKNQKVKAIEKANNAQLYFNFLLNADPQQSIDTTGASTYQTNKAATYLQEQFNSKNRTELKLMDESITLHKYFLQTSKLFWTPKLNGFLDVGSQASNWEVNNKSAYYFVGLQLDIPLFAGGKNNYKIKQAELNLDIQNKQKTALEKSLALSLSLAKNQLQTAYSSFYAIDKQLELALSYHKLIEKGYKEGVNSFIETVDARNQLTTTSLQKNILKYELIKAIVAYEREITP